MSPDKLELIQQEQESLYGDDSWGIVVIRHGYLTREFYTYNVLIPTRFDIWSGTKSFTGTAWGLLLEDSRQGRLPNGQHVELDSPAYTFIPEGYPLTDPRKERILVRHLLTMTSGIRPSSPNTKQLTTTSPCTRARAMCIPYAFVVCFIVEPVLRGFFCLGKCTQFRTLAQLSLYLTDSPLFRLLTEHFALFHLPGCPQPVTLPC